MFPRHPDLRDFKVSPVLKNPGIENLDPARTWKPSRAKSAGFLNNPGIKNKGKSRPGKSRDPGIWPNPVPENPGIENLDPARAWL